MVRSQHLWCLLYAIYRGQGGGICNVRYPGGAAVVCLLATVLWGFQLLFFHIRCLLLVDFCYGFCGEDKKPKNNSWWNLTFLASFAWCGDDEERAKCWDMSRDFPGLLSDDIMPLTRSLIIKVIGMADKVKFFVRIYIRFKVCNLKLQKYTNNVRLST